MQNLSDRALKERIIGAVVLVVFVVLVVPVFLDGGANEPDMIRETVTLPGQNEQERKQQTIVLERNRSEPVPATRRAPEPVNESLAEPVEAETPPATNDEPAEETAAPVVMEAEPEPPPAAPAVEAKETSDTGMWAVQLGSFSNQENAERLAAELRAAGFAAFLSRLSTDDGSLHRVRIGPQKDRESAETVASQIGADGYSGQVVPHP